MCPWWFVASGSGTVGVIMLWLCVMSILATHESKDVLGEFYIGSCGISSLFSAMIGVTRCCHHRQNTEHSQQRS